MTVHLIFLRHYKFCFDIIAFTSYQVNDIRNTFCLPIATSPRNICFLLLIHGKLYEITKIREAIGVMRKYSLFAFYDLPYFTSLSWYYYCYYSFYLYLFGKKRIFYHLVTVHVLCEYIHDDDTRGKFRCIVMAKKKFDKEECLKF